MVSVNAIVAIGPSQLNPISTSPFGTPIVTARVGGLQGLLVPIGNDAFRPADPEDVISLQPDGSIQGRPPGTAGAWELALQWPDRLIYIVNDVCYVIPYVSETP